jgi:hypothetical protein
VLVWLLLLFFCYFAGGLIVSVCCHVGGYVGFVGFVGFIGFIGIGFIGFVGFVGFVGFIGFIGFIGFPCLCVMVSFSCGCFHLFAYLYIIISLLVWLLLVSFC